VRGIGPEAALIAIQEIVANQEIIAKQETVLNQEILNREAAYNTSGTSLTPGGVPPSVGPVESGEREK
jgi:hypothetical protein